MQTPLPAEGEARLRRRWARVTSDGGALCDALIEYRKTSEARARFILVGVMTHQLPASALLGSVREANRDLSMRTGRECGNRFGKMFLLHLPQMAWLREDATPIAGRLAEHSPENPDPVRLLSTANTKSVFNVLTLMLYVLVPEMYYPWIPRIHHALRDVFGLPRRDAILSVEDYLYFCSLVRSLAGQLEFSPQVLDYLLYDLAEDGDAAGTTKTLPVTAPPTPNTAAAAVRKNPSREKLSDAEDDLAKLAPGLWWQGRPVPRDRALDDSDEASWFGSPLLSSEVQQPEKFDGFSRDGELRRTLVGYQTLNERSRGRYSSFLQQGAGCDRCAKDRSIPPQQQPVPLLCGTHEFSKPVEQLEGQLVAAHNELTIFRRSEKRTRGSLKFNPGDKSAVPQVVHFLDRHGLKGLSIGQCGWSDLTMRVRANDMANGVRLMILGNDWYPLSRCSNFLADRYSPGRSTMGAFVQHVLKLKHRAESAEVEEFWRQHRVYAGNALLCYRTGWDTNGPMNLSFRSFENCRGHIENHIAAVQPEVLVTFGQNSCAAVSAILRGASSEASSALKGLSDVIKPSVSLGVVMRDFCSKRPGNTGIDANLGDPPRALTYIPLYHPSWSHKNQYDGDYDSVRRALGIA